MKTADAPQAGWYPDPVKKERLRWWDGSDWTDDRRVGPTPTDVTIRPDQVRAADQAGSSGASTSSRPADDRTQGLKSARRSSAAGGRPMSSAGSGMMGQDGAAIVEQVRQATRSELDRATTRLAQQAGDLRSDLVPLIEEYGRRFLRWARRIAIIAAVLYILYLFASAQVQTNLLEWVGDRVDQFINE